MFFSFRTSFDAAVLCALFVFATATAALCQVYQWVDQRGVMHFTSKPPPADGRLINMFEDENLRRPNPADEPQGSVPAPEIPEAPEDAGQFSVTHVYDGDSFEAEGHNITIQVRLAGIDAPETDKDGSTGQPYSLRAKAFLAEMIEGRVVSLKGYGSGSYNRQLAEVFVDGKNVALELVRAGLAETYAGQPPKGLDVSIYIAAEDLAKRAGIGIWSQGEGYESPSAWRRRMR